MINYPVLVDGLQTRVLQSGEAGPQVVFVHGTGARADRWVRNLDVLAAQGFRCYALDLPGHGFADKSGDFDHSVSGYAGFLGAFLDEIGAESVILIGTSLGGNVTARYAVENPGRVSALVLVGSMGLLPLGEAARFRIQNGATSLSRDAITSKMARIILDPAQVGESLIEEEWRINNSPGAAESFARLGAYIAGSIDEDVVGPDLANLDLPILLVWGEEDKTVPASLAPGAHGIVPRATLALIAEAAHTAYWEQPEAFNEILGGFLAGDLGTVTRRGVTIHEATA